VSQRRACKVLGQARAVQRHTPIVRDDEDRLTGRIVELAAVYGRYGTPRIHAMLRHEGWHVNHKRVERIWRQSGLKVPRKQPKRGRLWLNDGSCIRLRPERKDHVWAYDFVSARTHDGQPLRLSDEFINRAISTASLEEADDRSRLFAELVKEVEGDPRGVLVPTVRQVHLIDNAKRGWGEDVRRIVEIVDAIKYGVSDGENAAVRFLAAVREYGRVRGQSRQYAASVQQGTDPQAPIEFVDWMEGQPFIEALEASARLSRCDFLSALGTREVEHARAIAPQYYLASVEMIDLLLLRMETSIRTNTPDSTVAVARDFATVLGVSGHLASDPVALSAMLSARLLRQLADAAPIVLGARDLSAETRSDLAQALDRFDPFDPAGIAQSAAAGRRTVWTFLHPASLAATGQLVDEFTRFRETTDRATPEEVCTMVLAFAPPDWQDRLKPYLGVDPHSVVEKVDDVLQRPFNDPAERLQRVKWMLESALPHVIQSFPLGLMMTEARNDLSLIRSLFDHVNDARR